MSVSPELFVLETSNFTYMCLPTTNMHINILDSMQYSFGNHICYLFATFMQKLLTYLCEKLQIVHIHECVYCTYGHQ